MPPSARSALNDIDFGLGLGCIYNAAAPAIEPIASADEAVETTAEPRLGFSGVTIALDFEDEYATIYEARLAAPTFDGERARIPRLTIFNDYAGSKDDVANLELFRIGFMRADLNDETSRSHDYSRCGDVAVREQNGDQQLRLHVGNESGRNACIFEGMSQADREVWQAVLDELETILATATGDTAEALRETYAFASR